MFKDWDAVKFVNKCTNKQLKNAFVREDITPDGQYLVWFQWQENDRMGMAFFDKDDLLIDDSPRGKVRFQIY